MDSTPFYETCVYDMCVTGIVDSFCSTLYEYTQACRTAGGNPGTWWDLIPECGNVFYALNVLLCTYSKRKIK